MSISAKLIAKRVRIRFDTPKYLFIETMQLSNVSNTNLFQTLFDVHSISIRPARKNASDLNAS